MKVSYKLIVNADIVSEIDKNQKKYGVNNKTQIALYIIWKTY